MGKRIGLTVLPWLWLMAGSPAFAYEITHPSEEFGELTTRFEGAASEVAIAGLAFSLSEFFNARMYGFTDKTERPLAGNYLELLNNKKKALIIYHDCYEGVCQKTPILEFSCDIEGQICVNPRLLFRGEEISFSELLRRGDFNLD